MPPPVRQLLRVANDEPIPEAGEIHEHTKICPVCRMALRSFRSALTDDPTIDPFDDLPENLRIPVRR